MRTNGAGYTARKHRHFRADVQAVVAAGKVSVEALVGLCQKVYERGYFNGYQSGRRCPRKTRLPESA